MITWLDDEEIATRDVYLEQGRILATRLDIRATAYRRVELMVQLRASPGVPHESVETAVLSRPYCYLNALANSNQGQGWLFESHLFFSDAYQCRHGKPDVRSIRVEMYAPVYGVLKEGKLFEGLEAVTHGVVASRINEIELA